MNMIPYERYSKEIIKSFELLMLHVDMVVHNRISTAELGSSVPQEKEKKLAYFDDRIKFYGLILEPVIPLLLKELPRYEQTLKYVEKVMQDFRAEQDRRIAEEQKEEELKRKAKEGSKGA